MGKKIHGVFVNWKAHPSAYRISWLQQQAMMQVKKHRVILFSMPCTIPAPLPPAPFDRNPDR